MRNRSKWILCMGLAFTMAASVTLSGCGTGKKDVYKRQCDNRGKKVKSPGKKLRNHR